MPITNHHPPYPTSFKNHFHQHDQAKAPLMQEPHLFSASQNETLFLDSLGTPHTKGGLQDNTRDS
ncbi:hypothetical protein Hanom_Chr09g00833361 [Helianthus anomalus]